MTPHVIARELMIILTTGLSIIIIILFRNANGILYKDFAIQLKPLNYWRNIWLIRALITNLKNKINFSAKM
jgi:hypothetical protein